MEISLSMLQKSQLWLYCRKYGSHPRFERQTDPRNNSAPVAPVAPVVGLVLQEGFQNLQFRSKRRAQKRAAGKLGITVQQKEHRDCSAAGRL